MYCILWYSWAFILVSPWASCLWQCGKAVRGVSNGLRGGLHRAHMTYPSHLARTWWQPPLQPVSGPPLLSHTWHHLPSATKFWLKPVGEPHSCPWSVCQNLSHQVTCTRLAWILQVHGVSLKAAGSVVGSASPALGADFPLLLCFLGLVAGWGWWFWPCPLKSLDPST